MVWPCLSHVWTVITGMSSSLPPALHIFSCTWAVRVSAISKCNIAQWVISVDCSGISTDKTSDNTSHHVRDHFHLLQSPWPLQLGAVLVLLYGDWNTSALELLHKCERLLDAQVQDSQLNRGHGQKEWPAAWVHLWHGCCCNGSQCSVLDIEWTFWTPI